MADVATNPNVCVRVDLRAPEEEYRQQVLDALQCLEQKADRTNRKIEASGGDSVIDDWLFWERINGA